MFMNESDTLNKTLQQDKQKQDRRHFLRVLAKSGAVAGLARTSTLAGAVLASRLAEALPNPPKKFMLLFHPGGAPRDYLNSIAVRPFAPFGDAVAALTMTISIPGNHGLTFQAAGANSWYANELNSSTIDQQIANTIGHLTPHRSMELGVLTEDYAGLVRRFGTTVPRIDNPEKAYKRYFTGLPADNYLGGGDMHKAMLAAHKQGLDHLLADISREEQFKLEAHVSALEEYNKRIDILSQSASLNGACMPVNYTSGESPLNLYRAQGDIAVSALACGLTNVASIQFNNTSETWMPNDGTVDAVPVAGSYSSIIVGGMVTYWPALNEYMNKGVAHIINKLMQAGIFQDTLVLCISEMGDTVNNSPDSGPITVATGISGFKGGHRKVQNNHYHIFPDVIKLLGLEEAINKTIYNYPGGGIIV
jgi:hypothetical protein